MLKGICQRTSYQSRLQQSSEEGLLTRLLDATASIVESIQATLGIDFSI